MGSRLYEDVFTKLRNRTQSLGLVCYHRERMTVQTKVLCGITGSVMIAICVVANKGRFPFVLDGIRYEWGDQTGQMHGASAFSDWNHTFPPGTIERTTFLIPRDAESVRIWVIYDSGSSLRKKMRSMCLTLASNPLAARFPRLHAWLLEMGFSDSNRRLASPWTGNR